MNYEVKNVIGKFKEVKNMLIQFNDREKAIDFLAAETKLSKEECSTAYDIIIKIED